MPVPHQTRRRIARHVLFWIAVHMALRVIHSQSITRPLEGLLTGLLFQPYNMALVYVALYWVLPPALAGHKQLFVKRLWVYMVGSWLLNFLYRGYVLIPFRTGKVSLFPNYHEVFTIGAWVMGLIIVGAAVRIKLYLYWQERERANQQLTRETLAVELQILRAQIHPHFLFNTLNNLYSLTLKQSAQASGIVLKLSGLLHYMIHECNVPFVPLTKEIDFLRNYIDLEKLRYGPRLVVFVAVEGDVTDQSISPLLLIPFVENAFKHGSSKQIGPAQINLLLTLTGSRLVFRLENSFDEHPMPASRAVSGLGLPNVRKRLQLLYPNAHTLTVEPQTGRFVVDLTIDLDQPKREQPTRRRFAFQTTGER